MLIGDRPDLDYWLYQLLWRQNITQAQGWIEDLAHCPGVNDATGVIESLQAGERRTGEAKLRVMIVLENVGIAVAREINQRRPACETHRHAERELMRRCDVNNLWRCLFRRPCDHDSFPVHWSRNYCRAGETKSAAGLIESWIFDPRDLTPIYQRHRADHHRLLRSSSNNNLVRMTSRASVITQIGRDRFAQFGVAAARCVLEQMSALIGEDLSAETLPDFYGEFVERSQCWNKGNSRRSGDPKIKLFSSAPIRDVFYPVRKAGWTFDQQLRLGPARAQESFGQGIGNECARSDSGSKVTLRMKFLEGEVDSESRDSQISGERARRGKTGGVIAKTA